jgi:ATP-binding cassette subfamily F protein 3
MDQNVTSALNPDNMVLHELQDIAPYDIVPQIRTLLGAFLFSGDDVSKKVSVLSGGEKSRLAIAKMLLEPANLLLLDEPTNHLDIVSQEILLSSLKNFSGTILFVSHERYFINELAEKIIEVDEGRITVYMGNYEDYRAVKVKEEAVVTSQKTKPEKSGNKKTHQIKREKQKQQARNLRKLKESLANLEQSIHQKERELQDLETLMADPELYREGERARDLVSRHKSLRRELQDLYDEWVELGDGNQD